MSVPSPNSLPWMTTDYGYVWMGYRRVLPEDIEELEAAMRDTIMEGFPVVTDKLSHPGRYAPEYTAEIWVRGETTTAKMGGIGSNTYEIKRVDSWPGATDVGFRDEDEGEIWHYHEGQRVYGKLDYPKTGRSYHIWNDNEGSPNTVSGPRPDTRAADILGKGSYVWDEENRYWIVEE